MGLDTDESLDWVLDLASTLSPPDRILLTGDLAQDSSLQAYQRLQKKLLRFSAPSSWLCGNHDSAQAMAKVWHSNPAPLQKRVVMGNWQVLMLHTQIEDEGGGELSGSELQLVERSLQEFPGFSLICMHHHPLSIHSRWMDRIAVANSKALWEILDKVPAGKVSLLCGHVHQEQERLHQGVRVMATPSTCFQFSPNSEEFGVTDEMPGLRMLQLFDDGTLVSTVHRITERDLKLDRQLMGY